MWQMETKTLMMRMLTLLSDLVGFTKIQSISASLIAFINHFSRDKSTEASKLSSLKKNIEKKNNRKGELASRNLIEQFNEFQTPEKKVFCSSDKTYTTKSKLSAHQQLNIFFPTIVAEENGFRRTEATDVKPKAFTRLFDNGGLLRRINSTGIYSNRPFLHDNMFNRESMSAPNCK